MFNFLSICSGNWNICAEHDLRCRLPLTGGINPYGDKKANCQVSDYKAWLSFMETLVIIRMSRIEKHANFRPNQFQNISFTYKQSNIMKGFENERVLTEFWYTTFAYIWSSQLSKIIYKFRYTVVKIALWCMGCLFPVRVNAPVRGGLPCKSYSTQIFQSPEQILGKFSILCISKWTWVAVRLIWYEK